MKISSHHLVLNILSLHCSPGSSLSSYNTTTNNNPNNKKKKKREKRSRSMSIILSANPHILYREIYQLQLWSSGTGSKWSGGFGFGFNRNKNELKKRDLIRAYGSFLPELSKPSTNTIEMEVIQNSEHLDQILEQAKQLSQPIAIDWMAAWCRKCIYLKPKFEKLAAEFDTKLKFYCVDVNNVPQTLVKRGNISKMPTIQIWKDGEMKAEVIGGHKAWLVIEEAREMIKLFV